ncbi:hypothetical protein PSEHALCIP103_03155 [Pseudoalteromonas haloplanktis]|uniref:Uncharacterized protein n=2 Tax=Pseudoalteromonas haloplanktis TaxID=228 RepID=A0A9W4R3E0_PSEHA|nr:hypothetical protein PSEHALCIP103_03155 [Pseudoalteromonas haloplanktis]
MKLMNLLENFVSAMKWLGVLAASFNYQDDRWVAMCLSVAVLGLVIDKLLRVLANSKINALNNARSREWSYLNVIRLKNEKGEVVDPALLNQSKSATKEADELYKEIYGFYRPDTAIKKHQNC